MADRRFYTDPEEIQRLLFAEDEDALPSDVESNSEPDISEPEVQDSSESEQDASSEDEVQPSTSKQRQTNYKGKNKHVWARKVPPVKGRSRRRNIVTSQLGPKGEARTADISTPEKAWTLLITEKMAELIVKHTNEEIERRRAVCAQPQTYHSTTDVIEMRALFGLLFIIGTSKSNRVSSKDLWDPRKGHATIRSTMPQNRFAFLLACIRFDDKTTRQVRRETDILAPIRDLWSEFITKCQELYNPSEYVTIDEQLLGFRGRCSFKMYIPSKPDKYGLKVISMNDAKTFYLINAIPYVGKVKEKRPDEAVADYFVREISAPIHGSNRNITCDNWFSSVSLFDYMLATHSCTMVGTLKKNKREIPPEFIKPKQAGSSLFGFDSTKTLVSYAPKDRKNVLLLSTMHYDDAIDNSSGKPEIILFYNSTKGGTDTFDQLCHAYTTARSTRRWPLRFFYGILDQSGVNAYVLFCLRNPEANMKRSAFLFELGFLLIEPQLKRRFSIPTMRRNVKTAIREILGESCPPIQEEAREMLAKRVRCGVCDRSQDRKTQTKCVSCSVPLCPQHQVVLCETCGL